MKLDLISCRRFESERADWFTIALRIAENVSMRSHRLALKSEEVRVAQGALEAAKTAKEDCERKIAILIENLRKAEREVRPPGPPLDVDTVQPPSLRAA